MNLFQRFNAPTDISDGPDRLHDECAVVGFIGRPQKAANLLERMLFALQNRGQQGSGITLTLAKKSGLFGAYLEIFREVRDQTIPPPSYLGLLQTGAEGLYRLLMLTELFLNLLGTIFDLVVLKQRIFTRKGRGSVQDVFLRPVNRVVFPVQTSAGIGHNRYKTAGADTENELQPLTVRTQVGDLAVVHNGNLTNAIELRKMLKARGAKFKSTSDSEVILHLIAEGLKDGQEFENALLGSLRKVRGAYCYIFLWQGELYAARDPHGFRPLSIGNIGDDFVIASETAALDQVGATFLADIRPGEVVHLDGTDVETLALNPAVKPARCSLEYFYFSNPHSILFRDEIGRGDRSSFEVRKALGYMAGLEEPILSRPAFDFVVGIPNSGVPAARGLGLALDIPFIEAILRNPLFVKRTFMEDSQEARERAAEEKYIFIESLIRGKIILVVDDSLVRGTTMKVIARKLFELGAKEVHFRSAAPAIKSPCYHGIDTPKSSELVAVGRTNEQIATLLGVNSVRQLSIGGVRAVIGYSGFCEACYTGIYPVGSVDGQLIQIQT